MIKTLIASACLTLLAGACISSAGEDDQDIDMGIDMGMDKADGPGVLPTELLAETVAINRASTRTLKLITSVEEYIAVLGERPVGVIDFERRAVLFYADGKKPTTGYSATIQSVRYDAAKGALVVTTASEAPGAGCGTRAVARYPYTLVTIPRPSGRVKAVRQVARPFVANCTARAAQCRQRTGGALITLKVAGRDLMTSWVTNPEFIDEAKQLVGRDGRIPFFEGIRSGYDCDPQWAFHVAPDTAHWTDFAIELCDSDAALDTNTEYWSHVVAAFCPWTATVESVVDKR